MKSIKSLFLGLMMACAGVGLIAGATDAEAKRIGGGKSTGVQRAPDAAQKSAPTAAPAATAAATPKRSWMGPLAGLAAGLGIAALMSHLGMGEGFGQILTMLLIAAVAFFAIRFLMARFGPKPKTDLALSGAGASGQSMNFGSMASTPAQQTPFSSGSSKAPTPFGALGAPGVPAGFDAQGFEAAAKMLFTRLQEANDKGDLSAVRAYATPQMMDVFEADLRERSGAAQRTEILELRTQLLDASATDPSGRPMASVRFSGMIREEAASPAVSFDEVWQFVSLSDGGWAIAGIEQAS